MPRKSRKHICQWCGKGFIAQHSVGHAPQYCSPECRKEYRRHYNSTFQATRRAKMTDEELEPNRVLARKSGAQRTWEKWSAETENILLLAKSKHPQEAITKYLCDNFRPRSKSQSPPNLSSLKKIVKVADKTIADCLAN